jgi:sec-independent protein translocase protein TatA
MGTFSVWHWLVVLAVVLVLFGGGGKISRLMGDFGKGLKSFKKSLNEEEEQAAVGEDDTKALSADQVGPERKKAAKS